jgi:hypothetical protein
MTEPTSHQSLPSSMFDIIASMVTTTPVVLNESPLMATVRMMSAVSLLIEVLEQNGHSDEFLSTARVDYEHDKTLVMDHPEQFISFLDDLTDRFVREVKRRNLTALAPSAT